MTKPAPHNNNPYPQTVELKTEIEEQKGAVDTVNVLVSLQFNRDLYVENGGIQPFFVSVSAARIDVRATGFDVVEKTKRGKLVIPEQDYLADEEFEQTTERRAGGGGKVGPTELSLGVEGGLAHAETVRGQRKVRHRHLPVRQVGGDSWDVTHEDGSVLSGFFLNNDMLCQCKAQWGGINHREIVVQVKVRACHVWLEYEGHKNWMLKLMGDHTGSKIARIVMSKRIHSMTSPTPYVGELIMARSTHPDFE